MTKALPFINTRVVESLPQSNRRKTVNLKANTGCCNMRGVGRFKQVSGMMAGVVEKDDLCEVMSDGREERKRGGEKSEQKKNGEKKWKRRKREEKQKKEEKEKK